jgi:4-hydroxythreonine-4-phosphate dehydrogenase
MTTPHRIAVTLGTLDGVGPELITRALARLAATGTNLSGIVVVGDRRAIEHAVKIPSSDLAIDPGALADWPADGPPEVWRGPYLLDPRPKGLPFQPPRSPGADLISARKAFIALEAATRLAVDGTVQALVTGPLDKRAFTASGVKVAGQTEYLAQAAETEHVLMVMSGARLTVGILTTHVPLKLVPSLLSRERLVRGIRLLSDFVRRRDGQELPRIAVAGLNPHLGDDGLAGVEDEELVRPAVEAARHLDVDVTGPVAADTVFHHARDRRFDAVLALYHDQGMIPVKLVDFDGTVNVTAGLPFVRVSPAHGPAYDLAWRGGARAESTMAAFRLALKLLG